MQFTFPTPEALSKTLTNLLGRSVTAKRAGPSAGKPLAAAIYTTASSPAAVLCLLDVSLGCSLGAALSMIPAAVASQSARTGTVAPNLLENLAEVMNVGTALLSAGAPVRLALGQVIPPGKELPPEAAALRARPAARADFEITVSGYEGGTLAILSA